MRQAHYCSALYCTVLVALLLLYLVPHSTAKQAKPSFALDKFPTSFLPPPTHIEAPSSSPSQCATPKEGRAKVLSPSSSSSSSTRPHFSLASRERSGTKCQKVSFSQPASNSSLSLQFFLLATVNLEVGETDSISLQFSPGLLALSYSLFSFFYPKGLLAKNFLFPFPLSLLTSLLLPLEVEMRNNSGGNFSSHRRRRFEVSTAGGRGALCCVQK